MLIYNKSPEIQSFREQNNNKISKLPVKSTACVENNTLIFNDILDTSSKNYEAKITQDLEIDTILDNIRNINTNSSENIRYQFIIILK